MMMTNDRVTDAERGGYELAAAGEIVQTMNQEDAAEDAAAEVALAEAAEVEAPMELSDIELGRIEAAAARARDQVIGAIRHQRLSDEAERDYGSQIREVKVEELINRLDTIRNRKALAESERAALIRKTSLAGNNKMTRRFWASVALLDSELRHHEARVGVIENAIRQLQAG
jgi:hypothetical protein